jgi:hypothetical protein
VKQFFCLDERKVWFEAAIKAAVNHGYVGKRIFHGGECGADGVGFIRPHVHPQTLGRNKQDYEVMNERLMMIQDRDQVMLYEDKSAQFVKWGEWMPDTWRFTSEDAALDFVYNRAPYPLVSKADVGASSVNVRILQNAGQAAKHVEKLFSDGIVVEHSSEVPRSKPTGYALLQRFIPHEVTWRVNAIGNGRAIFQRFCYKNRPVAQTGNVKPVMVLDEEMESLLEYADKFFKHAKTKWCALDILKEESGWKLLETSLAWPWPSPGTCNDAPIFGTRHKWIGMFEAMFDEFEEGAWLASS